MSLPPIPTITDKLNLAADLTKSRPAVDALLRWNSRPMAQHVAPLNQATSYRDAFANVQDMMRPLDRFTKQLAAFSALPSPLMAAIASLESAQARQSSSLAHFATMARDASASAFPWKKFEAYHRGITKLTGTIGSYDQLIAQMARTTVGFSQLSQLLPTIDLDRLEAAVEAASQHLEEVSEAANTVPTTLSEVRVVFAEADLSQLNAALHQTVHDAMADAIRQLRPTNRQQWRVVLFVVWSMVQMAVAIAGQPLFERMLKAMEASHTPAQMTESTSALNQLSVVVGVEAFVRIGPHTQQRYVAVVHQGDIVRVIRKRGLWTLIMTSGDGKDRMTTTGWVKTAQISPLQIEVADLLGDTSASD